MLQYLIYLSYLNGVCLQSLFRDNQLIVSEEYIESSKKQDH